MAAYLGELIRPNFSPLPQSHAFISLGHSASSPTNLMHWWRLNQKSMRQNCCKGVSQEISIFVPQHFFVKDFCKALCTGWGWWPLKLEVIWVSASGSCGFRWTFCTTKNSFSTWFFWLPVCQKFFKSVSIFFKKEKSLFGFAALLMNNTPGVIFDAWDLVSSVRAFCKRSPLQSAIYSRPRTCSYLPLWNAEWMNKRRSSTKGII